MVWDDHSKLSFDIIWKALFESYTKVYWSKDIWFKDLDFNYSLYCWLAYIKDLKTSDIFSTWCLESMMNCLLCNSNLESHSYIFFKCPYLMELIMNLLPNGKFFLMETSLHQILNSKDFLEHKALKRLNSLTISVAIYSLWKERNLRFHNSEIRSIKVLIIIIRFIIAFKLWWWKFKDTWPALILHTLHAWRKFLYLAKFLDFLGFLLSLQAVLDLGIPDYDGVFIYLGFLILVLGTIAFILKGLSYNHPF